MMRWTVLFAMLLATSVSAETDIAVIRDRKSPVSEQVYYSFAANMERRFVNFDVRAGKEAEVAKGVRMEGARVVFVLGSAASELIANLDPKVPTLLLGHGQTEALNVDMTGRVLVRLEKDVMPAQVLSIIAEIFPDKRRLGFAYNPKLTQHLIDAYRDNEVIKDRNFSLALLKVDQPADLVNLMPSFKDKIDLFMLIMDATLLKAGSGAMAPFLRDQRIPMVAVCELFGADTTFLEIEAHPFAIGKMAADVVNKMLAGQTVFNNSFEKRDITLTFSMKEAYKLKYSAETLHAILERATAAGYQVHLVP